MNPTSGVDHNTREKILKVLSSLSDVGMTIIMSTHDIEGIARCLPWIVCLNKTVIAEGHPSEVLTDMNLLRTYGLTDNSSRDNDDGNERTVVQ
jgi:zinc/manganese transport system ATP-binding protein